MGVSLTRRFDTLTASFDYDPAHPELRVCRPRRSDLADVNADYGKQFAEEFISVSSPGDVHPPRCTPATGPEP